MAERKTHIFALLLVGYCLLQVCGAGNVPCTVTQGANQTTYSVPDEGASDCSYSWANASDTAVSDLNPTVLAHEDGWRKDGLVRSANMSTFITSECFPRVIYTRDCRSKKEVHTSNCTVVCREKVVPPEDSVAEIRKTTSLSWIIPVSISFVILLIVGLIYFRRNRTRSYSPVNMEDLEANARVGQ